ncbi:hypothetical protein NAP1_13373 [Erythrobacter sp. NAP1]|uniref:hypothetical protein n=1 Tax=Erythrobacter sp. NAP1 TaxID=237727 RepID=UPI0000687858|nr:hypothetical protein [Erythrobacter sp. NAP1]EAQ28592.1 hypothetical protein NAP1_13373 [Erythrobacter sp. NAP1]
MSLARNPRPASIHGFALLTIAAGLSDLIESLLFIDPSSYEYLFPIIDWTRETVIVFASAMFTIVLIPVVAVWFFASRTARTIVTVMFAISLPWHLLTVWSAVTDLVQSPLDLLEALAVIAAIALLHSRASSRWLERNGRRPEAALA